MTEIEDIFDPARPGARGFVKRHAQHPGLRAFRLTGHVLPPVEPLPGALVVLAREGGALLDMLEQVRTELTTLQGQTTVKIQELHSRQADLRRKRSGGL